MIIQKSTVIPSPLMVLLMLLLIKISILYELFKKIIPKKDMYMFVFDPLIGMGPFLVIVILG